MSHLSVKKKRVAHNNSSIHNYYVRQWGLCLPMGLEQRSKVHLACIKNSDGTE
jgi:hypothetical protein